jgi:hypothetical protein
MKQISAKDKLIFSSILWAAVMGGFVFGVTLPLYIRMENFPELYRASHDRLAVLEQNIADFKQIKASFESIASNMPLIRSQFLPAKDPEEAVAFMENLDAIARENNLSEEMRLISEPAKGANNEAKNSFVFNITLTGSFEGVMRTIAQLEHFKYAIDVEKLGLSPVAGSRSSQAGEEGDQTYAPLGGDVSANAIIRVHSMQ